MKDTFVNYLLYITKHFSIKRYLIFTEDKTLQVQKDIMKNNGINGTCISKNDYDAKVNKIDSEMWVMLSKEDATQKDNLVAISNCNDVLRKVKSNLPLVNEIPKGYKPLASKLKEDWQTAGGLAKCANEADCPKTEYKNTEHIEKRLKGLLGENGAGRQISAWVFPITIALCNFKFFV